MVDVPACQQKQRSAAGNDRGGRPKVGPPGIEANPKLLGEREEARQMPDHQPANRPAPGTVIVTDKDLSGEDTEAFFASPDLVLTLLRPARKDEKPPATSRTGCGSASRQSSGR